MTMPPERTRALRWAYELLLEVSRGNVSSATDRDRAFGVLQDFPQPDAVLAWLRAGASLPASAASAINEAGALLQDLRLSVTCPPHFREQLYRVLRHYPQSGEALCWAGVASEGELHEWLQPEDIYGSRT